MTTPENASAWPDHKPTALLVLADGTVLEGFGLGAEGQAVGEVCFNTAMTGYQEILSDPSYAGQIVAFTFPHIGIVGANEEDIEAITPAVRGLVVRAAASTRSAVGLWSGQAEAFSGVVMSALHSLRGQWRQSRKSRIHMRFAHI